MTDEASSRTWSLAELAERIGGTVEGDEATCVRSVTGVEEADAGSLVRVDDVRYLPAAEEGPGAALLLGKNVPPTSKAALRVENSRLAFARCLELLGPGEIRPQPGVHPKAVIGADVSVGAGVAIMAGVVVGDGSVVGANSVLFPNVTLGERVRVGSGCLLYPNVCLYAGVEIGDRVRIHAGTVIGADGFGYVWDGTQHYKLPHTGTVRIGDDVEIGANCAIDRATTGATEIGPGTKIDNLVQIGHNVQIGPHCLIVSQAGLAGSAATGAGVVLGGQSALRDHVRVGDRSLLAGKSGVWSDLPAGGTYSGNPARRHMEEERSLIAYQRGPELLRRVRQLERELAALKERLEE